eukprot:TRINITY_DN3489_c0_g3_i3.p1 TRINITY_DN3489_c0_g3~~TRINITY_DN3489_c0_g3_i3.p1  ORF type:complete len:193 (+),score=19.88 TRINITY_DN3489_c0_g3_i3:237-815(+)
MEEKCIEYWVRTAFHEFPSILCLSSAKSLSLVSRSISNAVKPFIEQNFSFSFKSLERSRFRHYQPLNMVDVKIRKQINGIAKKVKFSYYFNKPIDLSSFVNITHIEFWYSFNQPVSSKNLPPRLVSLKFGRNFNRKIESLPHTIKEISLGFSFNYPLDNILPANLTHRKFIQFANRSHPPTEIEILNFEWGH